MMRDPPASAGHEYPGRVHTRGAIQKFLTSRRAGITPEQAGPRTYSDERHVPGLHEEDALLAEVSADYFTRLEREPLPRGRT
jgi:hypothetical protein